MSCSFLPNRGIDMNKNSDTMSEVSEAGTGTSGWTSTWEAKEDLMDFVTKLGLKDISDLCQDRFRVDRKKLEQMLTGDNEALIPADVFFAKIMEDTDTYITWPNKLKIGAKSKKDPHVRIAGRPEDVQAAKERIITILDTRCNRVTMKMDVGYTDHSHIIGKGGLSIKRVMEETHCHVHFPDSNRSNPLEKSNQVSISGNIEGVENARSRVRELIPLIFGFELPILSQNVDAASSYIVQIQEQYKVQVMFRRRPKLHATLVMVKGVEWEVIQVQRATLLLMEYMCGNLASQIPVQMSMEISPHHHQIVLGKNHANLKAIIKSTSCQIMFPDALDPNIPSLKKSNVNISGNIQNVYKARQLLMGSLPLIIIFDLPEDSTTLRTRPDQIVEIQTSCDVVISIRQKAKQNTRACVIKGIEKNAEQVYKARNLILGFDEAPIRADIPNSYHSQTPPITPSSPFSSSSSEQVPTSTNTVPIPLNPVASLLSPLMSPGWQYPPATQTASQQQASFVGLTQQPQLLYTAMQQSMSSNGYHSMSQSQSNCSSTNMEQTRVSNLCSTISSNNSSLASPRKSASPNYRNFTESSGEISSLSSASFTVGYHGPSTEKNVEKDNLVPFDLESKRLAALRAMQNRPSPGSYRMPTSSWSGYGVSHTSPANFDDNMRNKREEDIWKMPSPKPSSYNVASTSSAFLNTSNILDHTSGHTVQRLTSGEWNDLPTLLTSLGLERYIGLFVTNEIDLSTFTALTDQDLVEIGINAFGARKKILLAISELNKRNMPFSAAPGAERKGSTSSTNSTPRKNW